MRYKLYKMVFGDPPGGDVFQKWRPKFSSMKNIDESYKGPDYYWNFYQCGDLGDIRVTLLKFEIWTTWKENEPLLPSKAGFIGNSCGLFFNFLEFKDTWNTSKEQIEQLIHHQKKEIPVFLAISLYPLKKYPKKEFEELEHVKEMKEFIKEKRGDILFIPEEFLERDLDKLYLRFMVYFIKKLDKEFAEEFKLEKDMKYLDLEGVRDLLYAEKLGMTRKEWELKQQREKEAAEAAAREAAELEEAELRAKEIETEEEIIEEKIEEKIEEEKGLGIAEDDLIAISPEGEKVKLDSLDEEKLIDLAVKGFEFSEVVKAYIPRHCPQCGNHNQKMIFERVDRNFILMDYPRIYGLKTVCGNCGKEWHQK